MVTCACWAAPKQASVGAPEETAAANQSITLQPSQPLGGSERPAGEPGERQWAPALDTPPPRSDDGEALPLTFRPGEARLESLRDSRNVKGAAASRGQDQEPGADAASGHQQAGLPVSAGAGSTEDASPLRAADSHRMVKPRRSDLGLAQLGERAVPWYRTGFGALAIVLAVMGAACWAVRRWIPGAALPESGVLRVVGKTPLTPKHSATLVQMGSRFVLVGVSPDRIQMLCEVSDAKEVAELAARVGSQASVGAKAFDHLLAGEAADYQQPPTGGVEAEEGGEEVKPQPPLGGCRRPNRWPGRPTTRASQLAGADGQRRSRPLTDLLGKLRFLKSQSP